jgi:hypothetical protein
MIANRKRTGINKALNQPNGAAVAVAVQRIAPEL